jgi:hypothetical protein
MDTPAERKIYCHFNAISGVTLRLLHLYAQFRVRAEMLLFKGANQLLMTDVTNKL